MTTQNSPSSLQNPTPSSTGPHSTQPASSVSTQQSSLLTLELIAQRKAQKLEEVRQAKAQITDTVRQLFAPVQNQGGVEGIMQHVHTGIAIYDGVRTGIKIMQRIRGLFFRRTRR